MAAPNLAAQTIRDHLDLALQFKLVEQVRAVIEASPLVRPHTPNGLPMRVRVSAAGELGWVGDGAYRYSPRDRWGNPWPPIPAEWVEIADRVAAKVSPRKVRWNSAIINWYAEDAALGMHQDLAEDDHTQPIVTISLGDAASWAVHLEETGSTARGSSRATSRCCASRMGPGSRGTRSSGSSRARCSGRGPSRGGSR